MSPEPSEDAERLPNLIPSIDAPRWNFGVRHINYAVFYCALICWLLVLVGVPIIAGSLVVMVALMIGTAVLVASSKSTQQDALIWGLAIAAEHEMSLAPAVEAFSANSRGKFRRKLSVLAQELYGGVSLPEALTRVPRILPWDVELLVHIGWATGTLARVLREAVTTRLLYKPGWTKVGSRLAYLVFVTLTVQVIVGFIMYFIMPKFQAIYADFGLPLPPTTRFLIKLGYLTFGDAGDFGISIYGLVSIFLLLFELALCIYLPLSLFGLPVHGIPIFDRLFVRRHTAVILRALAWVVEGNKPLNWGVEQLSELYPTPWVRRRLRWMGADVAHGVDWTASMRHHGLIRPSEAALLDSAMRAGNLPWALRETALAGERRLSYRVELVLQSVFPVVILMIGAVVGLVGVAYFVPLIYLIERLAG